MWEEESIVRCLSDSLFSFGLCTVFPVAHWLHRNLQFFSLHLNFFIIYIRFVLCVNALPAYMYVYHVHAWCLGRSKEGIGSPETGAGEGCGPPCGCWDLT